MPLIPPGIHRISLPLVGTSLAGINIYVLEGNRGLIMIDTGWDAPGVFEKLAAAFASAGLRLENIRTIVATHMHMDHYGLAARLKKLSGAEVLMHRADKDLIDSRYEHMAPTLQRVARWLEENGVPRAELTKLRDASLELRKYVGFVEPDRLVEDGDVISNGSFNLTVFSTPGHSPGHICLYEPERRLIFTGDHVLPAITPHIGLNPDNPGNPLGDYLSSLARLGKLEVAMAFPAHGEPFTNFRERVQEVTAHHEERLGEILSALDSVPHTAYDLASRMTWMKDMGGKSFHKLADVDRRLAVMETASHLQVLVAQGRAVQLRRNGSLTYTIQH